MQAPGASQGQLPPDLSALRLKLVTLIDSISNLQAQLHHYAVNCPGEPTTANPGIPSYPELLARYNVLLSHVVSLGSLLSEVETAGGVKVNRKDKWESWTIVPGHEVEESKDWLVGMLLRTKQTPQVESHLANLVTSLPASITSPNNFNETLSSHNQHVSNCFDLISTMKDGYPGEEWDWRGRLGPGELEDENDDAEGQGGKDDDAMDVALDLDLDLESTEVPEKKSEGRKDFGRILTMEEVALYLRSGKAPGS